MNRQKTILAIVYLLLTGVAAGFILHASANQKLGEPGVRTKPLPGSHNLEVILPQSAPGYAFQATTQAEIVVVSLPDDTSFGSGTYTSKDGFHASVNVVLMGTDRSSIHKPQVCLTAQGWKIDESASRVEQVRIPKPSPYDLPVMRLTGSKQFEVEGGAKTFSCVYAYWYVDNSHLTAKNLQLMLLMAKDLLLTGVLDRFSYISYFSICEPGQEDATFARMKDLMAATVPDFQLVPKAGETPATRR
jgi:hypothetical protein